MNRILRLVAGAWCLSGVAAWAQMACAPAGPLDACTGTVTFRDGAVYRGAFASGMAHGQGSYAFASGAVYVGEFRSDEIHGLGTYTFRTGERYVGEFESSKRHGYGLLVTRDGSHFAGVWSNDALVRELKLSNQLALNAKPASLVAALRAVDSLAGFTGGLSGANDKLTAALGATTSAERVVSFLDLDRFDSQLAEAAQNATPSIRIALLEKFSPNQMPARLARVLSDIDATGGAVSVQVDTQGILTRNLGGANSATASAAAARTRGLLSEWLGGGRKEAAEPSGEGASTTAAGQPPALPGYARMLATRLFKQIPLKSHLAVKVSAPPEMGQTDPAFEHMEGVVAAQLLEASQFGARISPRASLQTIWKDKEVFADLDAQSVQSFLGKIDSDYLLHLHFTPGRQTSMLTARVYSLDGLDKGHLVFAQEPTVVAWTPLQTAQALGQSALTLKSYNAILFVVPGVQNSVMVNHIQLVRRTP